MKTLIAVKRDYPQYKKLIEAVVNNIGKESIEDVINHGIGGGFGGFIYYTDTVKFWETHKADIKNMLKEMADSLGENVIEMIGGFNCLKYFDYKTRRWTDAEGQDAIGETFYGSITDEQVGNTLAWFAAEEVCRMFDN